MGSNPNGPVVLFSARVMPPEVASTLETAIARMLFFVITIFLDCTVYQGGQPVLSGDDYSGAGLRLDDSGMKHF